MSVELHSGASLILSLQPNLISKIICLNSVLKYIISTYFKLLLKYLIYVVETI